MIVQTFRELPYFRSATGKILGFFWDEIKFVLLFRQADLITK